MSHLHIAHDPVDLDALLQVHEALRLEGVLDWHDPDPKGSPRDVVDAKINEAFALLVLVSQDAIRSKAVRADVERARTRGIPIIPYRLDKARVGGFYKSVLGTGDIIHSDDDGALTRLMDTVKRHYKHRCPVLAVMNLKGGIGKTTITSQVFGAYQADRANRILLVDLDPQYNLTQTFYDMEFADESAAKDRSVISLFEKSQLHVAGAPSPAESWETLSTEPFNPAPRNRFVHRILGEDGPAGRLDLISGQFEISKYAFASSPAALAEVKSNFLRALDHYRSDYDLIVFDTNPNATFLTRCALAAADRVIAPMHPDLYSLRGVRLLNKVIATQVEEHERPELSTLFNAVRRSEQSTFEADVRNGVHDAPAGFALSEAALENTVPRSGHLVVKTPEDEEPAYNQLLIHNGRGGGLRKVRESLVAVGHEVERLLAVRV